MSGVYIWSLLVAAALGVHGDGEGSDSVTDYIIAEKLENVLPTVDHSQLSRLGNERTILVTLERQMTKLRSEFAEAVKRKEVQIDVNSDVTRLRRDTNQLKTQFNTLQEELWAMKEERKREADLLAKVKVNEATIEWTKTTITEIMNEMKEISVSEENVTSAIQHRQDTTSELRLLKSDLRSLLSSHQSLKVDHERDMAKISQLQQEVANLRVNNQKMASQAQATSLKQTQIEDDVMILQNKNRVAIQQLKKVEVQFIQDGTAKISQGNENIGSRMNHRQRHSSHHDHLSQKVDTLVESVNEVRHRQAILDRKVNALDFNLTEVATLKNDEINMLKDATKIHGMNVTELFSKLHELDKTLKNVENDTLKHASGIQNLTDFTTSVYNLHDSTMQLFKSLDGIDYEMTNSIEELQKQVSKISYNVVQSHSSIDVIKQDQMNHNEEFEEIRKDLSDAKIQLDKDHLTLTSMHNDVLQISLKECKDENTDLTQDVRIANTETKVAQMERNILVGNREVESISSQLKGKVGQSSVEMWKRAYKDINAKLLKTMNEVQELDTTYEKLDKEISNFVYQLPKDCEMDVKNPSSEYKSGVYLIRPTGHPEAVETYCDMGKENKKEERWTVIQRRMDGSENFNRDWQEYKEGFGRRQGEYWIGNNVLHQLTDQGNYSLRIEFWDKSGNYSISDYDKFYVGDESEKFRLYIDGHSGNASDSMAYHNKQAFSTKDSDNDASSTHCAVYYSAGWWFTHCQYVNANGLYNTGLTWYDASKSEWIQLQKIVMKIRKMGK